MLPNISTLSKAIAQEIDQLFRGRVNGYLGVIHEVPRHFIQEGRRTAMLRENGEIDETELKAASTEFNVKFEDLHAFSPDKRLALIDQAARDMANQISNHAFSQINEATEKAGNVVGGVGRPFGVDTYLEVIEKIQLDFDRMGNPSKLTMVISPHMRQDAEKALEQLENDPKYAERYKEIIDKKRLEWRDREAARKLVG